MIAVYISERFSNTNNVLGWPTPPSWGDLIKYPSEYCICKTLDDFRNINCSFKISFDVVSQVPNQSQTFIEREKSRIASLSNISDIVFVTETEIHPPCYILSDEFRFSNVIWITAGDIDSSNTIIWPYHLWRMANLYNTRPQWLHKLQLTEKKSKQFDALLGNKKPHREFIVDSIEANNLVDDIIYRMHSELTYNFIKEPEMTDPIFPSENPYNHSVNYYNEYVQSCSVVPVSVYNQTLYSIVAETSAENSVHMPTEKTAKPMLGRRLFVVFAGAGFLQHLKNLGFKTFSEIIDETYDQIENNKQRWTEAFNQVKFLCNQPYTEISKLITPIVEHNYCRLMNLLSLNNPITDIENLLNQSFNLKVNNVQSKI